MNKKTLLILAAILLVVAIILPGIPSSSKTFDYVFIIDITRSMTTRDYLNHEDKNIDRLVKVKAELIELTRKLPCGSKIGLGVFTERMPALFFSPVETCSNFTVIEQSISHIDWRMAWSADSNISKALYNTLKMMKADDLSKSTLVFVTDGHEAPPVNPRYEPDFSDINTTERNPIGALEMARQNRMGMNQQADFDEETQGTKQGIILGVGGTTPTKIPKYDEDGIQKGFYTVDDVPHASRFGLPEDPSKIEGYHPRNGPWGNKKVVGTEHLSSIKETYLKGLADKIDYDYFRLIDSDSLFEFMTRDKYASENLQDKDYRFIPAFLSLILISLVYLLKSNSAILKRTQS